MFKVNVKFFEILQPRSRKFQDEQEQSQVIRNEFEKKRPEPDHTYERKEGDWWWCDDV